MRILPAVVFVFLTCGSLVPAQTGDISPGEFEKLRPDLKTTYVYVGGEELFGLRSCFIVWIGVKFDGITFSKADSILDLRGRVFDEARLGEPALESVQILVGHFQVDETDFNHASFRITETRKFGNSSQFHETFKLNSDEFLCFALVEETELDVQGLLSKGEIERLTHVGWVRLYNVGRLIE